MHIFQYLKWSDITDNREQNHFSTGKCQTICESMKTDTVQPQEGSFAFLMPFQNELYYGCHCDFYETLFELKIVSVTCTLPYFFCFYFVMYLLWLHVEFILDFVKILNWNNYFWIKIRAHLLSLLPDSPQLSFPAVFHHTCHPPAALHPHHFLHVLSSRFSVWLSKHGKASLFI